MGRGAMVEFLAGREGLVPKDHLTTKQIGRIEEVVNVGDAINVKVFEVDAMGRINLTALGVKQELAGLEDNEAATPPASTGGGGGDRGGYGGDRGGRGGDRGGRGGDRGGRGGDRGGRGGNDRGPREDRPRDDRPRDDRSASAPVTPAAEPRSESVTAPKVPDAFPARDRGTDEDVNARFRPRR
jgi:polyribonucleotide nucleotidyltransferase